jgi:hypothetical protein
MKARLCALSRRHGRRSLVNPRRRTWPAAAPGLDAKLQRLVADGKSDVIRAIDALVEDILEGTGTGKGGA